MRPYVSVRDLSVTYRARAAYGRSGAVEVRAVDGIDLEVLPGETVALVGGSGSGKTTTGKAILHLVPATNGTITVGDFDVSSFDRAAPRAFRRDAQMVFQNIVESLNPAFTVAEAVGDPLRGHFGLRGVAQRSRVLELLDQVGSSRHADVHRNELRWGSANGHAGASVAGTAVHRARRIGLRWTVESGWIIAFRGLQREHGIAYLFITHDLAVART
jgi:ABC-type glutathione transport system ATPase component